MTQGLQTPALLPDLLSPFSSYLNPLLPRPEYPRPNFRRNQASWLNLNGRWEFAFDDTQRGLAERWQYHSRFDRHITVPFVYHSQLSGVDDHATHEYLWYGHNFTLPHDWLRQGKQVLLHFGAVNYHCQVWVNGRLVGQHRGGSVPFSFNITDFVKSRESNRVVVYVAAREYHANLSIGDASLPGIWQTVWLEAVSTIYLDHFHLQTDIDRAEVTLSAELRGSTPDQEIYWLRTEIELTGQLIWQGEFGLIHEDGMESPTFTGQVPLPNPKLWSPEKPQLYDLKLTLYKGTEELDRVRTYFGMRKISCEGEQLLLNNQPYPLRTGFDQSMFADGLLTAPSDHALRSELELAKALGFNSIRKPQKIEDPRWLYWADRLGLLVWGEMAATPQESHQWSHQWHDQSSYQGPSDLERPFIEEWLQVIKRDYNHPSLIAWLPFHQITPSDQSPEQYAFIRRIASLTRDLDKTRLVLEPAVAEAAPNQCCRENA